ncbi:hypothetical protein [Polynucleobacter sp. MWH-Jannik1A5]|jgi:hypothetical protein|uniref:hypothetical protein n=1 Tax=Polynucleobacter sp. MWH-Jannik1A5 TaxID=1855890 RepID=UPI001C0D1936|nr:hypothetical protein [Polynucleobacter sp. MWH-Jannik1A5]MBU3545914.1 hypothetical protein [Polynucleobacter sp. MWH-Jannik1A5]
MKTYPIALELTVWMELGLNQYEVTIDEVSKISIKRTDDVLRTRELTGNEVSTLIAAIESLRVPVSEEHKESSNKPSTSYELIVESAHFSLEFNWEDLDLSGASAKAFTSVAALTSVVESLDLTH